MSSRVAEGKLAKKIPEIISALLGPPPILSTESAAVYYGMLASFAEFVDPTDLIAWMLIKDMADSRVEIARYRQLKCQIIKQCIALEELEKGRPTLETIDFDALMAEVRAAEEKSDAEFQKDFEQIMADTNARDALMARIAKAGPLSWIAQVEQIEPLQIAAEDRFTVAREELERHLNGLARGVWEKVIEGEIIDTAAPSHNHKRRSLARPGTTARRLPRRRTGDAA